MMSNLLNVFIVNYPKFVQSNYTVNDVHLLGYVEGYAFYRKEKIEASMKILNGDSALRVKVNSEDFQRIK